MKNKIAKMSLLGMAIIFSAALILLSCSSSNTFIKNEHYDKWTYDLEYIKEEVPKRGRGFYEFITEEVWKGSIDDLIGDINATTMTDEEINYRILEILTKVNNGHTGFKCGYNFELRTFPVALWSTSKKEYYVLAIAKDYEKYLGAKLISINDYNMEEVTNKLLEIIPNDNPIQIEASYESTFLQENDLNYLGITKKNNIFTFEMLNGEIEKVEIKPIVNNQQTEIIHISELYINKPLKYQRPDNMIYEYWYTLDKDNDAFYFQYNVCHDKNTDYGNKNLPDFSEFSNEMIKYMKENDESFDTVVIDLRKNAGGNSGLFHNFIMNNLEYLSQKQIKVLTSKITYSSGVSAVNDLYSKLNVKSYGSETGGLIGGFTDLGQLYLKKTGSIINFSTAKTGYDDLKKRQENEFEGFIPDLIVEDSIDDFRTGVDRVYDTAIHN